MEERKKKESAKKPYVQPKIVKVKLLAEEAILAGCKVSDSGSAQGGPITCNNAGHAACSGPGS